MKKIFSILILTITFFTARNTFAQTAEEALKDAFAAFDTSHTYGQMLPVVNQFRLIASKWPDNWLANYYAAYSIIITSFVEPDKKKKDGELDEAETFFNKIKPLASTNEEVNIMGALLASGRIGANPGSFKKFGEVRDKYLDAVKAMNPNNPRIYLIEGNNKYYTPKMFGGGAKNALPFYQKAQTLYATEQQTDITKPYWGKTENDRMIAKCDAEIKK